MALRARLNAFRAAGLWLNDGSTSTMRYASGPTTGTMRMTNSQNMGRPVRNKCTMAKRVRAVVSMAAIGILQVAIKRGAPRIILDLGMRGKPGKVESRLFCDRILN